MQSFKAVAPIEKTEGTMKVFDNIAMDDVNQACQPIVYMQLYSLMILMLCGGVAILAMFCT